MDITRKIDAFDRQNARALGEEALQALGEVAGRHGLTVEPMDGAFTPANFSMWVTFAPMNYDQAVHDFRRFAGTHGLRPEDLDRTFQQKGRTWTVTGLSLKRQARPIRLRRDDGRVYWSTPDNVRLALADSA